MSEPTPRLNLIQRAMQQGALKREPAGPVDGIVMPSAGEAGDAPVIQRRPQNGEAAANLRGAASPQAAMAGVRLNMARLRESRMVTPDNRSSVTYNEFRAIKRKLLPLARDPQTQAMTRNVIMITSALAGEGKTYTAMNLAIGLAAERNLDVILVDGDVVRASIAGYFAGSTDEGLTDLLVGRRQHIDEVMHRCADLPNLHVIFSGRRDEDSPEMLASNRMGEICAALSKRFKESMVVIDAPPVLATAEPSALATHVHQLIMVVAAGQVTRNHVEEALAGVSACPSINLVFNKSPEWQRPTPYPYYYNYAKG
jgi:protein-tyrosine kinase